MKLHEPGLIIFTNQFSEMTAFYRDVVCLPVRVLKPEFSVFHWGNGYLMIEPFVTGHPIQAVDCGKAPFVLRLNVFDLDQVAEHVRAQNISVQVERFDWGTVAAFCDPDGNHIELKDAPDFFE